MFNNVETSPSKVVHDLNQPLNSIKMIAGGILFMLKQGKELPTQELADCMQEIFCQSDKIAAILKKLQK